MDARLLHRTTHAPGGAALIVAQAVRRQALRHVRQRGGSELAPQCLLVYSISARREWAPTTCRLSSREHARGRRGVEGGRGPHQPAVVRKGHHLKVPARSLARSTRTPTLLLPPSSAARSPRRARCLLVSLRPRLSGLLSLCGRRSTRAHHQSGAAARLARWRRRAGGDVRACMQAVRLVSQRGATWRTGTTRRWTRRTRAKEGARGVAQPRAACAHLRTTSASPSATTSSARTGCVRQRWWTLRKRHHRRPGIVRALSVKAPYTPCRRCWSRTKPAAGSCSVRRTKSRRRRL